MKNQSKIRFIALVMAVCASLTACGNAADDNMDIVQYTEGKQQEQTTKYDSIYDSMDDVQQTETASDASYVKISEFEKASNFNEGHAIVTYGGKYYIIDTTGNIVLEFTDAPKEYTIYNGGFIILENENVMNIKGEIVADTAVHGHDMVRGIWHEYIVLRKKVDTLERTGFDYCILNSDGSVHVDWAPNPYHQFDGNENYELAEILELNNNYIKIHEGNLYPKIGVYNLETSEYHDSLNIHDYVSYVDKALYEYGYVISTNSNGEPSAITYDYTNNIIDVFSPIKSLFMDDIDDNVIFFGNNDTYENYFYDVWLGKNVNLPFNVDNINKMLVCDYNKEEALYIIVIQNKENSVFYTVIDENGNYVVEAIKDEILTCNDGVYTAENGMYKTDGTLIFEGNSFGQFTDGYCCMNENSYIDINGNKLEVEFKTE